MLARMRRPLTFANVVSVIALFVALGGGAYAAVALPKNSVGSKQLKKNAVTNAKIGKNAVTGAKVKDRSLTGTDINLATLPKVGSATNADNASHATNADNATNAANATNAGHANAADTATTANSLVAPEAYHEVGAGGEPAFQNGASNVPSGAPTVSLQTAGFMKDHDGFVHLKGLVQSGTAQTVFVLPAGYRPADAKLLAFNAYCNNCTGTDSGADTFSLPSTTLAILGANANVSPYPDGAVIIGGPNGTQVSLDGIVFRAGA
jgi:hypothetical protein